MYSLCPCFCLLKQFIKLEKRTPLYHMENNCAVRNNTKAEKPKIRSASFAFIGRDVCAFILSQSYILPLLSKDTTF